MKVILNKLPLGVSAIALSLFVMGNVAGPSVLRNVLGGIAGILLLLVIIKVALSPSTFKEEMNQPIVLSTFATFSMALSIMTTYIVGYNETLAKIIWVIGLLAHLTIMVKVALHIKKTKIVLPSYYVTFVGIVAFSVSSKMLDLLSLGNICLWIGSICFLALTPFVFHSLIHDVIPKPALPTKVIVAAPLSLIVVGYLSVSENVNFGLVTAIYCLSILFLVLGLYYVIKTITMDTNPTYASYTFPLAISTLASLRMKMLYVESSFAMNVKIIYNIELFLVTVIIMYVIVQYCRILIEQK